MTNPYYDKGDITIYNGNCFDILKTMKSESVDCIMTSPPYYALRDYGVSEQIGQESTYQDYINKLCNIFEEAMRVLKKDGTCWVNLGDSYLGSGGDHKEHHKNDSGFQGKYSVAHGGTGAKKTKSNSKNLDIVFRQKKRFCCECGKEFMALPHQYFCSPKCSGVDNTPRIKKGELENKCLLQIPSRFAIEMCNRGWILRNKIIWHKPNCMPASVCDRFTVDFEEVFFFTKNKKYCFNQQLEPYTAPMNRWGGEKLVVSGESSWDNGTGQTTYRDREMRPNPEGRNKRAVWSINTRPYKGAHFATYPPELCKIPIIAGSIQGGTVLDIFMGSGTTLEVALKYGRKAIGIEINKEYCALAIERLKHLIIEPKLNFEKVI